MEIYSLDALDTRQKISLYYALKQGYRFELSHKDGDAIIHTPHDASYNIHEWTCDCADTFNRNGGSYTLSEGRKICKHVMWLSQLYPCPKCSGFLVLRAETTKSHYRCCRPTCHQIISVQAIKASRERKHNLLSDREQVLARAAKASHAIFGH
jgi:hypothetical protein